MQYFFQPPHHTIKNVVEKNKKKNEVVEIYMCGYRY